MYLYQTRLAGWFVAFVCYMFLGRQYWGTDFWLAVSLSHLVWGTWLTYYISIPAYMTLLILLLCRC